MRKIPEDFFVERYGLQVRLATEDDAQFIVDLRTDPALARHISHTSGDVEAQRRWLRDYKEREARGEEYYFIIQIDGRPIGTDRLYNIEGDRFVSGSWVFSTDAPMGASVLGGIICKEIAYSELGLERDTAEVRKDNRSVIRYNMSYEPTITGEDEQNIYLEFSRAKFEERKKRHIEQCGAIMRRELTNPPVK